MNSGQPHRWSGWPGAICLDCGAEDKREVCAALCHWPPCDCEEGSVWCGIGYERCDKCSGTGVLPCQNPECQNDVCPEPGSRNYDPDYP